MACVTILPAVSFNDNCQTIVKGQIYNFYVTRATSADVLADVEDLDEWEDRLDQSTAIPGSGAAPIRKWSGIGQLGEGEVTDIEIPLDQTYSFTGNQPLTFEVYDMTAENIAAAIAYRDAGTTTVRAWFAFDQLLAGGDSGIVGQLRANLVVPQGRQEPSKIILTFSTKNSLNSVVTSPLPTI